MHILDCARETLVLLGIIILQTNLDLHRLQEVPLLLGRVLEDAIDALVKSVPGYLGPAIRRKTFSALELKCRGYCSLN